MNTNEHIKEFLDYYCKLEQPGYAVMITGAWGSGKSWFIRNYLANHDFEKDKPEQDQANKTKENKKEYLIISLYGVQSFSEIEDDMYSQLHPILSSKTMKFAGKVLKGLLKTAIKVDLNESHHAEATVSGVDVDSLIGKWNLNENIILAFDDIERCSIPIQDLLGYINQFVEHTGLKAILIANETEIFAKDKKKGSEKTELEKQEILYQRIKEKLIGRSFEVKTQYADAIKEFISELPLESRSVITCNDNIVKKIFDNSGYENLRILRHSIWDFSRLYSCLDQKFKNEDPLISELISIFLALSIEIRSGALEPEEINNLKLSYITKIMAAQDTSRKIKSKDEHLSRMQDKYRGVDLSSDLLEPKIWEIIFTTGSIPATEINLALRNSRYFLNEIQKNWVKLWFGFDLEDIEFKQILNKVQKEWDSRKYLDVGEVVQVASLLLYYRSLEVYQKSEKIILNEAKKYIEWLIIEKHFVVDITNGRDRAYRLGSYEGKRFCEMDSKHFKHLIKYLDEKYDALLESEYVSQANLLLVDLANNPDQFFEKLSLSGRGNNIFHQIPILVRINPSAFVQEVDSSCNKNWRVITQLFQARYQYGSFAKALFPEVAWLKNVSSELKGIIANKEKWQISRVNLESVLDQIQKSVNELTSFPEYQDYLKNETQNGK